MEAKDKLIERLKELIKYLQKRINYADGYSCVAEFDETKIRKLLANISSKQISALKQHEKYPVIDIDDIDSEMVKRWYQKLTGIGEDEMRLDIRAMAMASHLNRHLNWEDEQSEQKAPEAERRDELIAFYEWKCVNNLFLGTDNKTCAMIVDEYLNSKKL